MENYIAIAVIIAIAGAITAYLIIAKKRTNTCIGCPYAKNCKGSCNNQQRKESSDKKKSQ